MGIGKSVKKQRTVCDRISRLACNKLYNIIRLKQFNFLWILLIMIGQSGFSVLIFGQNPFAVGSKVAQW